MTSPPPLSKRGRHGFDEAHAFLAGFWTQTVDQQERVVPVRLQGLERELGDVEDLIVGCDDTSKPGLEQSISTLAKRFLAHREQGGRDHDSLAFETREDPFRDRDYAPGLRGDMAIRATGFSNLGEQKAKQIDDLARSSNRRAGVLYSLSLFDRDGRRKVGDEIDLRSRKPLEKLPGVGRKRSDIATLTFSIESVEGQGRLPRSRHTGDHGELADRDFAAHTFQVVRARIVDANGLVRHAFWNASVPGHRPQQTADYAR